MEDEEWNNAFVNVVEAEERVKLMKKMISKGVGVPEVEYYFHKQSQHCRVGDNKDKRNEKQILDSMKYKLRDAVTDVKNLRKKKVNMRRRIYEKKGSEARSLIRELERKCRKIRADLKAKNEQKVSHLVGKFKP